MVRDYVGDMWEDVLPHIEDSIRSGEFSMIATVLNLSENLWAEVPATKVDIHHLQAKDFQKWMRKQVRTLGRKAEVATRSTNAVEMWLKELGLTTVSFQSGGDMWFGEGGNEDAYTGWISLIHYMTDEDGNAILTAGEWLNIANIEQPETYLIVR
jgi:hypothetical protein